MESFLCLIDGLLKVLNYWQVLMTLALRSCALQYFYSRCSELLPNVNFDGIRDALNLNLPGKNYVALA